MTPTTPGPAATRAAGLIDAAARDLVERLLETTSQLRDPVDRAAGALRYRAVVKRAVELLGLEAAMDMREANRAGRSHQAIADQLKSRSVEMGKGGVGYWIDQAELASPTAQPAPDTTAEA